MHDDEITGKAYDSFLIKRLLVYIKPYVKLILLGISLTLVASLLQLAGPLITKIAIDDYIRQNDYHGLYLILVVYVVVLIFVFITQYFQIYITQLFGQKLIYDIRSKVFAHIQHLSLRFFDKNPVGRLMTRVTSDIESLNQLFTQGIVTIFGDIFLLTGIIGTLLYLNFRLALWTFSVVPILFLITFLFRSKVREGFRNIRKWIARINSYMQENITGMSIVQIFNRVPKNYLRFSEINQEHTNSHVQTVFYYALFYPAIELVSSVAIALVIWRGGIYKLGELATFGALVAFIQLAQMFFRPISDLSEKYNILQQAMASAERVFKLLDTEPENVHKQITEKSSKIRGSISFQNVFFAYNEDNYVLKDVSFNLAPGDNIAVVGHTGAGKTSLINVLGKYYDIQSGDILVDNISISKWDMNELRKQMAVVLQDVFLFSGSISDNIRLGNNSISDEEIIWAAKQVNAHQFIQNLPDKYNTYVKERGISLSLGQKQLISFARALVINPEILILDEATSSVDTETELLIQSALSYLMRDRTSIIIAHRLSTIKNVDKIIVMHKGRIKEMGKHNELIDQKGLYYQLYLLQYKDQEREIFT